MSALEGSGRECSVVMHKDAAGVVTAQWEGREPGSWVKASCEAIDAIVEEANKAARLRFALTQARCALEVAQESSDINASSAARHALKATAGAAAVSSEGTTEAAQRDA